MVKKISSYYQPFTRISLFIIYFWFGILKVFGDSPATPLVTELHSKTISFIPLDPFLAFFGWFEMFIGVLFLFPRLTKIAIIITLVHLFTTAGPLVLLPHSAWQGFLVPTFEGQYIIKNLLIVSTLLGLMKVSKKY